MGDTTKVKEETGCYPVTLNSPGLLTNSPGFFLNLQKTLVGKDKSGKGYL